MGLSLGMVFCATEPAAVSNLQIFSVGSYRIKPTVLGGKWLKPPPPWAAPFPNCQWAASYVIGKHVRGVPINVLH